MEPTRRCVIALDAIEDGIAAIGDVGGKAAHLALLSRAPGLTVPAGFCITASAYRDFVEASALADVVSMELGRKHASEMRWEEMWDGALRIRNAFLRAPLPAELRSELASALATLDPDGPVAVRSSALDEDAHERSFAGLHETVLGVRSLSELVDAVRRVWASLWSDAAILYRSELDLDPSSSAMAVLVQVEIAGGPSGVMFGLDPRSGDDQRQIIEAVPGECRELVDGLVDPDRYVLSSSTGELVAERVGERDDSAKRLLDAEDLGRLRACLREVERVCGWKPDLEWTGRGDSLTVLQARPVTPPGSSLRELPHDDREKYLSLRLSAPRLRELRRRIEREVVPGLKESAARMSSARLEALSDLELADAIRDRRGELSMWRGRYDTDLIPFAHGVRYFGAYYNDAVQPTDPFEFVGLLCGQDMIAVRRNRELADLSLVLRRAPNLRATLAELAKRLEGHGWERFREEIILVDGGAELLLRVERYVADYMSTAFGGSRLDSRPLYVVANLLELSADRPADVPPIECSAHPTVQVLESRLLAAVGAERRDEALELLDLARYAWRLRDDDNILLARVEAELLRAIELGAERLRTGGRWSDTPANEAALVSVVDRLEGKDTEPPPTSPSVWVAEDRRGDRSWALDGGYGPGERARQLVGQPAAAGIAIGRARHVRSAEDLGRFCAGEILVCDAIQPMMTHLVPLAGGIVERRGGMLIHGAIIARETGIPCVNGIAGAVERIPPGERITVDGYLGIVTVGTGELAPP